MRILVTGGAGFIGANFLRLLVPQHPEHQFVNLDKLTYAANLASLQDLSDAPNYVLEPRTLAGSEETATATNHGLQRIQEKTPKKYQ